MLPAFLSKSSARTTVLCGQGPCSSLPLVSPFSSGPSNPFSTQQLISIFSVIAASRFQPLPILVHLGLQGPVWFTPLLQLSLVLPTCCLPLPCFCSPPWAAILSSTHTLSSTQTFSSVPPQGPCASGPLCPECPSLGLAQAWRRLGAGLDACLSSGLGWYLTSLVRPSWLLYLSRLIHPASSFHF